MKITDMFISNTSSTMSFQEVPPLLPPLPSKNEIIKTNIMVNTDVQNIIYISP
jgi:hypothetical protein